MPNVVTHRPLWLYAEENFQRFHEQFSKVEYLSIKSCAPAQFIQLLPHIL